jgi:anaerobic selenocysteine-containing dehydrogenase
LLLFKKEIIITEYWLITPKANKALNTQFKRDNRVFLHPSLGFKDEERVKVYSKWGEHYFFVKNSEALRNDAVVIPANTVGVNFLTPSIISDEGDSACYQEVKVKIERE